MVRFLMVLVLALSVHAAEFYSGQASRAVLGQSSFSSRDAGVSASAMTIANSRLYVGDNSSRVLTFDLAKIPGAKDDISTHSGSVCAVCGFVPIATVSQSVAPGSSTVALHGRTVAAIDTRTHRVLIWRDVTSASAALGPDVVIEASAPGTTAISDTTLIDPISIALDGSRMFVGDGALRRVLVWRSVPSSNTQAADAVLGQKDFASSTLADLPRADTISRPDVLASDGANLFVGDSVDRRILVFSPADVRLTADAVVNSASLLPGPLAPGTLVTISGNGLADRSAAVPDDGSEPLPSKLAGTEVLFDGVPLSLVAVSPTQIRTQLPYATGSASSASLYVRIERADGTVATTSAAAIAVVPASPALFAFEGTEPRPGMVLHATPTPETDDEDIGEPVSTDSPAVPGEILTLWATGLHTLAGSDQLLGAGVPHSGADVGFTSIRAVVNGQVAEVLSARLPKTSMGIYQVRVIIPEAAMKEKLAQVYISQDGYASNTVTFPMRASSTP